MNSCDPAVFLLKWKQKSLKTPPRALSILNLVHFFLVPAVSNNTRESRFFFALQHLIWDQHTNICVLILPPIWVWDDSASQFRCEGLFTRTTRKSSCVNARGIRPLHSKYMLCYSGVPPPPSSRPRMGVPPPPSQEGWRTPCQSGRIGVPPLSGRVGVPP